MTPSRDAILQLLELGRWAPSGDNTQPWRFEILADDRFVIHGHDTRDHCVYNLDGAASQLSIGALIETLHIAASAQALRLAVQRRLAAPETRPTFDVTVIEDPSIAPDPLLAAVTTRSVNRRPYSRRPLPAASIDALSATLPPGWHLRWYASPAERWQLARLMFFSAKLRLTMRESYKVHRAIIDWGQRFSADKVPDQALGVDALTLKLMRWVLADWRRVQWFNRWMAGTVTPRIQMDLLPAMACAAHVAIVADKAPAGMDDHVASGRAVQRFWLQATMEGLQHQPELTPLIFTRLARHGTAFSRQTECLAYADAIGHRVQTCLGADWPRIVWLGRIGAAAAAASRSLRRPLASLNTDPCAQR